MEQKGLLFEIVIVKHKRLLSEIVIVKEIGSGIIFFLLGFLNLEKLFFQLWDKFRKKCDNDMAANVAQPKCSNIKYYALIFTSIYI